MAAGRSAHWIARWAWEPHRPSTCCWRSVLPGQQAWGAARARSGPDGVLRSGGPSEARLRATAPAVPLTLRASASDEAGRTGVLSSAAMVDLYSQVYAPGNIEGEASQRAMQLREAY